MKEPKDIVEEMFQKTILYSSIFNNRFSIPTIQDLAKGEDNASKKVVQKSRM